MRDMTLQATNRPGSMWLKSAALAVLVLLVWATGAAAADIVVGRQWASTTPAIDGVFTPGEWSGSRLTALPKGKMRTMNDSTFVYILLDFTADTVDDGVAGDYYVLAFDADSNHAVTPNVDLTYDKCNDGRPFVKSFYLGEHIFTACRDVDPLSQGAYGFGPTSLSATPHRYYEFRLLLTEIGVDPSRWTTASGAAPKVRLNVALISGTPSITSAYPDPNTFPSLNGNMFELELAIASSFPFGGTGPIFAGVGLVPASYIDSLGNANMDVPGYYSATAAPFGGNLNVFGNFANLRSSYPAQSYRVKYRKDGGPLTTLLQTWTNFRFNPLTRKWIPVAIGPDESGMYQIPSATDLWYLPDLLMSWQSGQFADGTYSLRLELFDKFGNPIPVPSRNNNLTLKIVNTPPTVRINQVLYNGGPVGPCTIVLQGPSPEGFTFDISVVDARGALDSFALTAIYGDNISSSIYTDSYAFHIDPSLPESWNGVTNLIVPPPSGPPWRAPATCAYSFILSAASRSQNGYGRVFPYVDYHVSLTIDAGFVAVGSSEASERASESGCRIGGL